MGRDVDYTPEQRTKALTRLALTGGNVQAVADELVDDEFMVPADTLRHWMLDAHAEQYKRLERELADRHERATVATLRETVEEVSRLKLAKAREVAAITRPELLPQALRALSDAENKSVKELLALTGRPVDGKSDGSSDSMTRLLIGMVDKGFIKPAAGFDPVLDGQAEEVDADE